MTNLFTDEYIEKCVQNTDLQALWKPQQGQYCVCPCETCRKRNAVGYFVTDYMMDAYNKRDLTNVEPKYASVVRFEGQEFVDNKEGVAWVPRQDELQILLKEKREQYRNMTALKFDFNMRHVVFKTYCTKILNLLTFNDMWLTFFMRDLFRKQWVPERKEWMIVP